MKRILPLLAATVVLSSTLGAAFKPEPIPDGVSSQGTKEWHRGTIKLGDKQYAAALIDVRNNGFKLGHEDVLLVDLNGDGQFDFDTDNMVIEAATPLMKRVAIAGDTWHLSLDADAPNVTLTQYKGDCGHLKMSLPPGTGKGKCTTFGYVTAGDTAYLVSGAGTPATRLPAGDYEGMFVITSLEDGKPSSQLQYSSDGKFSIEKDKTRTIALGNPGELKVLANERGNTLRINRTLQAGEGMQLGSVTTAGADGKMKRPKPPDVEIRSPDSGELIASGKMEYG